MVALLWMGCASSLAEGSASISSGHQKHVRVQRRSQPYDLEIDGDRLRARFGSQLASAGDINSDGFSDVVICDSPIVEGQPRVLLFLGSSEGLQTEPKWIYEEPERGGTAYNAFGVGDLDDDGFGDLLVHASNFLSNDDPLHALAGDYILIVPGSMAGPARRPTTEYRRLEPREMGADGIIQAAHGGDVNGDGIPDVALLLARKVSEGLRYSVAVAYGPLLGNGISSCALPLDETMHPADFALAAAGDVNGDGFSDLVVGSPTWSGKAQKSGKAYVYHGSREGLQCAPAWSASYPLRSRRNVDEAYEQHFGMSVSGAGDVNRDGFDDVLIGAPFADDADLNEGLAFMYFGSSTGLASNHAWKVESNQSHALLGYSLAAGDLNGDGFSDILIGAPYATDNQFAEGGALAWHGSKAGISGAPDWSHQTDYSNQHFASRIAKAGDVNGDGFDDILISSPDHMRNLVIVGRIYLFYGSEAGLRQTVAWSIEKPVFVSLQQIMTRFSNAVKGGVMSALLVSTAVLLVVWRRAVARLKLAEREAVRKLEREAIARDLHDDIGAELLQLIHLAQSTPREPLSSNGKVANHARELLDRMRKVVRGLNTETDTIESFAANLADDSRALFSRSEIQLRIELPTELPGRVMRQEARSNLAMMTRELIRNVLQHSAAASATLRLTLDASVLSLEVVDDGVGTSKESNEGLRQGNGLKNLHQRAAKIGARLDFKSAPKGGTCVRIRIPLHIACQ